MKKESCPPKVLRASLAVVLACGLTIPSIGYAEGEPQPQVEAVSSNPAVDESAAPDMSVEPIPNGEVEGDGASQEGCQPSGEDEPAASDTQEPASGGQDAAVAADQQEPAVGDGGEAALENGDQTLAVSGEPGVQPLSSDGANATTETAQPLDEEALQQAAEQGLVIEGTVVTDYTGNGGHVDIPEGITEIGIYAFHFSDVSSVTWPSTLKTIGQYAFSGTDIVELEIPAGLEHLGYSAFGSCELLESVSITGFPLDSGSAPFGWSGRPVAFDIPDDAEEIPSSFFSNARIGSIDIPSTVTSIGDYAFQDATGLAELALPEGLEAIGDRAFEGSDVASIAWPSTLKTVGQCAFRGTDIVELEVPAGLEYLGYQAFASCELLESVSIDAFPLDSNSSPFGWSEKPIAFDIPDDAEGIPSSFFSCANIGSLDIPSTVTSIGDYAFQDATGLAELALPEGLEAIGDRAFEGYGDLKAIYIPDSVTSIGSNCFSLDSEVMIYCSEGSVAHQYAVENLLNYSFGIIHTTHEYGEWYMQIAPTCTDPGTERRHCDCGAYEERVVDALGHDMGEWVVDVQPTLLAPGSQHRDCSRCSYTETQAMPQLTVDLEAHPDYALATLHVVDAQSLVNIEGASVTLQLQIAEGSEPAAPQTIVTNAKGLAKVFIPSGTYTVQVEKDGYQLRGFEYKFQPGETTLPDIGISTENLVQGELTVTEMSKDEIVEAGIDVDAPGNQHVFKYEITLVFQDGLEQIEVPSITYKNDNGAVVGGSFYGKPVGAGNPITVDLGMVGDEPTRICRVNEMLYIVIQGEAKWLKEMFHVQLLAVNTSKTDTVEDAVATLELPEGVSLADMSSGQQTLSLGLGTMAVGEQKTADWYVRGDATGDYTLTAELTGEMQPFGDVFTYTYQNEDPLHVYAGTDMKLTVHIDDAAYYEEPYTMYFQLENVSDRTIYDVTHQIKNLSQYEVTEYTWIEDGEVVDSEEEWTLLESVDFGDEAMVAREEFKPGESLWVRVTTKILWESPLQSLVNTAGAIDKVAGFLPLIGASVPAVGAPIAAAAGIISDLDVRYWLSDTMVSTLEGSTTTIPVSFDVNHVEGIRLVDKIFEEITGISPDNVEGDIAELVGNKTLSVLVGKETVKVAKFVYKETKSIMEVALEDETTTCSAWVETVEGSNVLDVDAVEHEGGGTEIRSLARSASLDNGTISFSGNTELTVTALNPGVADLVVQDENGNIARKRFVVRDKLPAQEQFLPEGTDTLQLDYVLLPGNTVFDEATAMMYEQLGISLYSSAAADAQPVAVGSVIPNGAALRSSVASADALIVIPGDVNSDGLVDEADASVMENAEAAAALESEQRFAGDLNGDGVVDTQDAAVLRAFLASGGDEPQPKPEPTPDHEPGPDVEPEPDPGTEPEPDPGTDPEPDPTPDQDPGTEPGTDPGHGTTPSEEGEPSADDPAQKDVLATELAGLAEQIESSKLSDTEKQELLEQIQAMQGELGGAADASALAELQGKVEALSAQVTQSIEDAGKQESASQGQESGDPGTIKPLDTGEGQEASDESSDELVSTGDASARCFSVAVTVAVVAAAAICLARRKARMR